MKRMLSTTQYYFYAGSNYIDFSMYPDFEPKRLMAVINTTSGQTLIYATGGGSSSATGGTFGGSFGSYQLNLTFDTSGAGMSDTDILQIIYDESVGTEEAKASVDIVSGKSGLDVNLLNSSFGGTIGDVMPAPFQDNALSIGVLNGGVLESPAMNVNNELIVDVTQSGPVPVSLSGAISTDLFSFAGGNNLTAVQPLPATPTNPFTGSYQSFGAGTTDANTQRVTANIYEIPDLFVIGNAQSAIQNNIITGSGTSTSCEGYRSFSAQIVSTGTSGTFIFEGSNDNVNFQPTPVFNNALLAATSIVTAITATASQFIYVGATNFRYIRIRIVSTIGGGTIRAYLKLSQVNFTHNIVSVVQPTASLLSSTVAQAAAANLNCTALVAGATLSATTITDIAVAAQTVTATSANITTGNQSNMAFQVSVTGASGTNPTLDVVVQETFDGTNYFDIYHFPRITTVGQYQSPQIRVTGAGIRYVRTLGGTTPNFTNGILRPARQTSSDIWRNFINRTIDPNTLNSATPSYLVEGCDQFQLAVTMNAGGTAPQFKLQGSNDNLNWYDVPSTTLTATVGSTVQVVSSAQCLPKFLRATTSTAGSGSSLLCLCITARGV